jgi:hypothetical protein
MSAPTPPVESPSGISALDQLAHLATVELEKVAPTSNLIGSSELMSSTPRIGTADITSDMGSPNTQTGTTPPIVAIENSTEGQKTDEPKMDSEEMGEAEWLMALVRQVSQATDEWEDCKLI